MLVGCCECRNKTNKQSRTWLVLKCTFDLQKLQNLFWWQQMIIFEIKKQKKKETNKVKITKTHPPTVAPLYNEHPQCLRQPQMRTDSAKRHKLWWIFSRFVGPRQRRVDHLLKLISSHLTLRCTYRTSRNYDLNRTLCWNCILKRKGILLQKLWKLGLIARGRAIIESIPSSKTNAEKFYFVALNGCWQVELFSTCLFFFTNMAVNHITRFAPYALWIAIWPRLILFRSLWF